jgi:flap endonuclease-1
MGIQGLSKLLADQAPKAISEHAIGQMFGRKVAIDASMSIYQFLIAVRSEGAVLTNETGETTSHLLGMFYRTIRMLENGIKPVYVFDGKPPALKSNELKKRSDRRADATKELAEAEEVGNAEQVDKFSRRLVKVTKQHNDECKKLLTLMGIPYVESPSEAEAQCASMARHGIVFAAGSEDMDTLTFGSPVLLRHLTFSEARKMPINQLNLAEALEGLELSMSQFIDLCILLGCDYCPTIKGIGPKKALSLIKEHKSIEGILDNLDTTKYPVPEDWFFKEARKIFENPDVLDPTKIDLKWNAPNEEELVQFLVQEKGFNEERVRNNVKKINSTRGKSSQGRLDAFFTVKAKAQESVPVKQPVAKKNGVKKMKK